MSTDYNRTLIGSGSIEQVFGGDRNRSFRMSSFVYSWNDVNFFPVYVLKVGRNMIRCMTLNITSQWAVFVFTARCYVERAVAIWQDV